MSDRAKRIEEAARYLLDYCDPGYDGWDAEGTQKYDALRAALSTPAPEGGDAYRRGEAWHAGHGAGYRQGVEDAANWVGAMSPHSTLTPERVAAHIRALAPAPAPEACALDAIDPRWRERPALGEGWRASSDFWRACLRREGFADAAAFMDRIREGESAPSAAPATKEET